MTPRISSLIASRREAVDRTLEGIKLLPSNAPVAMKVLELKRREGTGAADLASVIAADPSLAAKILALANSAAFAPVRPITRLSIAIAQIGMSNLLPLVFGVTVAGLFNRLSLPPEDQALLWRAALLKAITARACVRRLGGPFSTPDAREAVAEEAFLAALFQDMALPVFHAADRSSWPEFLVALDLPEKDRSTREIAIYGVDHPTISATVARNLGLPDMLVSAAGAHHAGVAEITAAGAGPIAIAVDAAASLPHRLGNFSAKLLNALAVRLNFSAKASAVVLAELARDIAEDYTKTTAMFDKPEDASASYKQFLQNLGTEVAECLQSSILSSAKEIGGLKEHQRRLGDAVAALEDKTQRAQFDPLTNVLTRTAFIDRLDKLLPMARRHGASCAVGFLDLDNFKSINDTHSHAGGDAALIAAGAALSRALKESGIAGRIGGDEFVFAFVARPEAIDAITNTVVSNLARVRFVYGGIAHEVSSSVGVLPLGVPAMEIDAKKAIHDADRLMYEAKRNGKGRGHIGKPASAARGVAETEPASSAA